MGSKKTKKLFNLKLATTTTTTTTSCNVAESIDVFSRHHTQNSRKKRCICVCVFSSNSYDESWINGLLLILKKGKKQELASQILIYAEINENLNEKNQK